MTSQHPSSVLYILHYSLKHTLKPLQRSTLYLIFTVKSIESPRSSAGYWLTLTAPAHTRGKHMEKLLLYCRISNKILQFQDRVLFPQEFGLHGALLHYLFMRHKYGVRKEFIMLCLSLFNCFPRTQWEQLESI